MLIFIDESGCPGFKLTRGFDPIFAIAMVVFSSGSDAARTEEVIRTLHRDLAHRPEFKFSKCRDEVRDGFFQRISCYPFSIRALIVRKADAQISMSRKNDDAFYNFLVKQLMKLDGGTLANVRVRIDGRGNREFRRALSVYLRRELPGKVCDVRMKDSSRDQLIQLADMCVGAIARAYRNHPEADRWLRMLRPRIANIWEYK
jgi:hypothetical protein